MQGGDCHRITLDKPDMRRALLLGMLFACGSNHATPDARDAFQPQDAPTDAPMLVPFRNPVSLPDDQLALQALQIMGADVPNAQPAECNQCHALTRQHLRYWRALGESAMTNCLTDLNVTSPDSARTMLNCLRAMPTVETSAFQVKKLGIYASAARLG